MAHVPIRRIKRVRENGVKLNKANPIARKFDFYAPLGNQTTDIVGGIAVAGSTGNETLFAGKLGKATNFADADYYHYGDVHDTTGSDNLTAGLWVKFTDTGTGGWFSKSKWGGVAGRWGIEHGASGEIQAFTHDSSGNSSLSAGTGWNDGQWHFVVFTVDNANGVSRLYVDGIERANDATLVTNYDYSNTWYLWVSGVADASGQALHGSQYQSNDPLSDVFLCHDLLSAAEINSLYNNFGQIWEPQTHWIDITSGGLTNYTLTVEAGAYTVTGSTVNTLYDRVLVGDAGSYTLTGAEVSLLKSYRLVGDEGTYTITGAVVDLLQDRVLTVDSGIYTITGADVTLTYSAVTNYTLTVEAGSYTVTGASVNLLYDRVLQAESGTYTVTGAFVTLLYSGAGGGSGPTVISGNQMLTTKQDTALPIEVIVDQGGGISGLTILAKIRDPQDSTSYLDFDDMTFKTSGWTDIDLTLTDLGGGFYATTLDVTAITNLPTGKSLSVEYTISGSINAITQHSILFLDDYLTTGKFIGLQ